MSLQIDGPREKEAEPGQVPVLERSKGGERIDLGFMFVAPSQNTSKVANMKTSLLTAFAVSSLCSAELVQFKPNNPAKADEVNRNFFLLDSSKADKSTIGLLTSAVNAKADAKSVEDLAKSLASKADSIAVAKALRDSASALRSSFPSIPAPVAGADTAAKRRIDSLAQAAKSSNAVVAKSVIDTASSIRGSLAGKMDKVAITPASIGALPSSNASHKGVFSADGLQVNSMARSSGSEAAEPGFRLIRTDAPVGNQIWDWTTDKANGSLFLRTIQDDEKASAWAMKIDRKGLTPTVISLYASTRVNGMLEAAGGLRIHPKQEIKFGMAYDAAKDTNTSVIAASLAKGSYLDGSQADDFIIRHKSDEGRILMGAGTGNPVAGLEISSKSVKVNIPLQIKSTEPWADYVFEVGYQPMPLKEIEAFAKEHKHLPEVPSTADVEKDGIDIAKMNAILLKKVEELTLHAVEQEKKMDALQAEVREMKASVRVR